MWVRHRRMEGIRILIGLDLVSPAELTIKIHEIGNRDVLTRNKRMSVRISKVKAGN